jgi:hypothetical protein
VVEGPFVRLFADLRLVFFGSSSGFPEEMQAVPYGSPEEIPNKDGLNPSAIRTQNKS